MSLSVMVTGPTNVGKSSLARRLLGGLDGLSYLCTGQQFRRLIDSGDVEAVRVEREYFSKGLNAPDDVTMGMVEGLLSSEDYQGDVLFDGFPRNADQARALDELRPGVIPVYLFASDRVLLSRAGSRLVCEDESCGRVYNRQTMPPSKSGVCDGCHGSLKCRDDDPSLILKRAADFRGELRDLEKHYGSRLVVVNGEKSVEEVYMSVLERLPRVSRNA